MVLGSWEAGEQRSFLLPTLKPYAGPGQNGAAHPRKQALGISTATATWKLKQIGPAVHPSSRVLLALVSLTTVAVNARISYR